jgi:hypothetical protein
MTDEATPNTGAESAAPESAPEKEPPKRGSVEALKAILSAPKPSPSEPEPTAPDEGKPEAEAKPETEAKPAEAPQKDAEAPEQETDASASPDLKAVAKMLGVSPTELVIDEDGTLSFKTKIDGQEGKAKPAELRKSFQLESAHTRRLMELSDKQKAFDAERERVAAELDAQRKAANERLAAVESHWFRDFEGIDWRALQATDPVEFAVKHTAYQMRQQELNKVLEGRAAEAKQAEEAAKHRRMEALRAEYTELLNHVPSWTDDAARKQGQKEVAEFLKSRYSFSDQEMEVVASSSKAIRMALDALAYQKHQAAAEKAQKEVIKKIEAAPKMAKPGQPTPEKSSREKTQALLDAHRKGDKAAGLAFLKRAVLHK